MTTAPRPVEPDVAEALAGLRRSVAVTSPGSIQAKATALHLHGLAGDELEDAIDDLSDELVAAMLRARPGDDTDVARGVVVAVVEEALELLSIMPAAGRA